MKKLMIITGLSLMAAGCYNDKSDKLYPVPTVTTCDTTTVTYANDIQPILVKYCNISGGCHDAAGASSSGYDFTDFSTVQGLALSGRHLLLGDIKWESGFNPMPKGLPKLSDCDINKVTRWINQGALNN